MNHSPGEVDVLKGLARTQGGGSVIPTACVTVELLRSPLKMVTLPPRDWAPTLCPPVTCLSKSALCHKLIQAMELPTFVKRESVNKVGTNAVVSGI